MDQGVFSKPTEEMESLPQNLESRTRFPLFIKVIIVFVVFGLIPSLSVLLVMFLRNLDSGVRIQAGFFILLFVGIIFAGILFSVQILLKPLGRLLDGVRKLTKGEYGAEIKINSQDEFAVFADYFNQMSQKLKITLEREKAISQMKSEFISLAAHQLRTPLSAIKWTIKMLLDGDAGELNPGQKEFLEKGYQSNERIIKLINDLLDVAKIEEGKFGYNFSFQDIAVLIEELVKEQELRAQQRDLKIIFKKPSRVFPKIKTDPKKIKLAIENLLENSINYTLSGGLVEITIEPFNKDYLEVKIKDTGVGIPKDQQPRLFTKFFRSENVIKMQTDGSGLGLFIAKNIIKRHGGDIWIESEEGKGTTAHFTLPLEERLIPEKEEVVEEFITGF